MEVNCNQIKSSPRDSLVDIIRGFAILLVVLGHTISGCTTMYQGSFLYQFIWTLQMPLFIIISGYVNRYSKPIESGNALWIYLKKRTLAYLLPWAVWTFLIRGGIFQQRSFFNLNYLFWHMDSGYWFLITIWTLSVMHLCADFISYRLASNIRKRIVLYICFFCIGVLILSLVGYYIDFSFFCIKLTLYYSPFFLIGSLSGRFFYIIFKSEDFKEASRFFSVIFLVIWLFLISRYDFCTDNTPIMIILRFLSSLLGCISIISLLSGFYRGRRGGTLFRKAGVYSLEIYLTHYLVLNLFKMETIPELCTHNGLITVIINYIVSMLLVISTIALSQKNTSLYYLLYAKKTSQ